ncbi:class I SAM-dependent methyltransferase [Candidatus Parcubacteria bacterium]|nr:class I SAM-dependent methyltransferase [Patescibacteria group bacterium]MBU4466531.1 class I SAM-dependent methyltransferase [Patescibacteria group bacterium]MCG2688215.1 class I SAM-dependent methyltransferase [Candidatus Parcubacteria bacterium]
MEFLNPEQVLNQLELAEGMLAADFGCGVGGWAIPLANKLKDGRVYAVDVQEDALSGLRMKADMAKIKNIKPIKADLEGGLRGPGSLIQNNLLDLVLMTNLLFQAKNKKTIFQEAKRILRPGGQVLVVDWKSDATVGPLEGRIDPEVIKTMAKDLGFSFKKEISAGNYHYGLVFIKS